jgi:Zn-dependent M28 family amino/carboxypeptidase
LLAEAAALQGRTLVREPTPEKGYFYRSDHFSFAKQGVPVLYAEGGEDIRGKGPDFGAAAAADYVANRYHKPGDEFDPSWDLSGAIEDMALYFRVALSVADGEDWPEWYEGNEFRATREADLGR